MRDIYAAQISDDQTPSSYRFPLGDTFSDILWDIDDHISFPSSGIQFKKVSKLPPYPSMHSRHYYRIEGNDVIHHQTLA